MAGSLLHLMGDEVMQVCNRGAKARSRFAPDV